MKTTFALSTLLAIISTPLSLLATTWTVSNNQYRPAQFTEVQDALNAAAPYDTIVIAAGKYSSATGILTSNIPLVIRGESGNNPEDYPETVFEGVNLQLMRLNKEYSASGSKFYGIDFRSSTILIDGEFFASQEGERDMSDFLFVQCAFTLGRYTSIYGTAEVENVVVENCLFVSGYQPGDNVLSAAPDDDMIELRLTDPEDKPLVDGCPLTQDHVDTLCAHVLSVNDPSPGASSVFGWAFEEDLANFFNIQVKHPKTPEEEEAEWNRMIDEIVKYMKVCTPAMICEKSGSIGMNRHILSVAALSDSVEVFHGFITNLEPDLNYIHPEDQNTVLDTVCRTRNIIMC